MIKSITIFYLALFAHALWANVRFPADGGIGDGSQEIEVASQVTLPLSLEIRSMAQVASDRIYLQDIATCNGVPFACTELLAMDVEESAQPGQVKSIAVEKLRYLVRQEFPQFQIDLIGADQIRVESKHIEIGQQEVRDALMAVLSSRLQEVSSIRIRSLNVQIPRAIKAWPGDYNLQFPVVQEAQVHHLDWLVQHLVDDKSWTLVYAPANVGANRTSIHKITVHLELEMQVPVARTHLPRGTLLKHGDFEYKWVRVGRQSVGMVQEVKNLVGLLTKQAVRSGQTITYRLLEVPEVVARGEKVKILLKRPGLNVTGEGKALNSGGVGQNIAVFYPATKKTIHGKIIGSGLVEVQL